MYGRNARNKLSAHARRRMNRKFFWDAYLVFAKMKGSKVAVSPPQKKDGETHPG